MVAWVPIVGASLAGIALSDVPILKGLLGTGNGGGNQGGPLSGMVGLIILALVAVGGLLGAAYILEG